MSPETPLTPALSNVPSRIHTRAYILDEATPPEDLQGVYQLCDLHQREIKAVVNDPAFASSVYNVRLRGAHLVAATILMTFCRLSQPVWRPYSRGRVG